MIERIPQKNQTDCAICVVAMAMEYSYERVLTDSTRYAKVSKEGNFYAWWESYLAEEGFRSCYRPFSDLYQLPLFGGAVVGLLGMDIHHLRAAHIVCVDEIGVIDPADGAPSHARLPQYILDRQAQGVTFHTEFLAVERHSERSS
jgi:hypothetical protein